MALFSVGSSFTYHLAPSVLNVITTFRPFILPPVMFPKALFSAIYSSIAPSLFHAFKDYQADRFF